MITRRNDDRLFRASRLAFAILAALALFGCPEAPEQESAELPGEGPDRLIAHNLGSGNGGGYSGSIRPPEGTYYNGISIRPISCSNGQVVHYRSKIEILQDTILHTPDSCSALSVPLDFSDIDWSPYLPYFIGYQDRPYTWIIHEPDGAPLGIQVSRWCFSSEPVGRRIEVAFIAKFRGQNLLSRMGYLYLPVVDSSGEWSFTESAPQPITRTKKAIGQLATTPLFRLQMLELQRTCTTQGGVRRCYEPATLEIIADGSLIDVICRTY